VEGGWVCVGKANGSALRDVWEAPLGDRLAHSWSVRAMDEKGDEKNASVFEVEVGVEMGEGEAGEGTEARLETSEKVEPEEDVGKMEKLDKGEEGESDMEEGEGIED
jgi:hypothetical protein